MGGDKDFDTILEYLPDSDAWKEVGKMKEAKRSHAVSTVRFEEYSKWCNTEGILGLTITITNNNSMAVDKRSSPSFDI